MTDRLQTLLHEVADDRPDFDIGDPWQRGRRMRLARRLGVVTGTVVTVGAVVAGAFLLSTPSLTSSPEPAQEDSVEPTLPDTLYEVPLNLADISDDPLGEPAAVVYRGTVHTSVYEDGTVPIVVGALSGEVRAVRDAGMGAARLSPDGTMLAVGTGWTIGGTDGSGELQKPVVYVTDMITGQTRTHTLPDEELGGGVDLMTWLPGSSELAVTSSVTTDINSDGDGGTAMEHYGRLDVRTGEWRENETGNAYGYSADGQRVVIDQPQAEGTRIQNVDGSDPVEVETWGHPRVAFSPDGHHIAAIDHPGSGRTEADPYAMEVFESTTGELVTRLELGEYSHVSLLGWGARGVVIDTSAVVQSPDSEPKFRAAVERIDLTDLDNPVRTPVIEDEMHLAIDVAADFLDADTRRAARPEAGFDWMRWVPEPFLLVPLAVVAALIALQAILRRRRPRAADVDAHGPRE